MANIALNKPSGGQLILSPEDGTSTETVSIPAAGIRSATKESGEVLQIVQGMTSTTAAYASAYYQQTALQVTITVNAQLGVTNHDIATACNIYDSANPSGSTAIIAPESVTGGSDTSGNSGHRMGGYYVTPSFASQNAADDWWWSNPTFTYDYVPSYQSTDSRTFSLAIKSSYAYEVRLGMGGRNASDPRDARGYSIITVREVENG